MTETSVIKLARKGIYVRIGISHGLVNIPECVMHECVTHECETNYAIRMSAWSAGLRKDCSHCELENKYIYILIRCAQTNIKNLCSILVRNEGNQTDLAAEVSSVQFAHVFLQFSVRV